MRVRVDTGWARRVAMTLALAGLVFAAGCLGSSGDADERNDEADADAEPANEPSQTEAAEQPTDGEIEANQTRSPTSIPVDWEGNIGTQACVPSGVNSCGGVRMSGSDSIHVVEAEANLTGASLALHWNETSPLTDELEFGIYRVESCGDRCQAFYSIQTTSGTSPLTLDGEGLDIAGRETIALSVDTPRQTPSPIYAKVSYEQPFHAIGAIEGMAEAETG